MELKTSQIQQIDALVKESEQVLQEEIIDNKKVEALSKNIDTVIATLGDSNRFFKRMS